MQPFWIQGQERGMAIGLLPGVNENIGQGEGEQDQGEGVWVRPLSHCHGLWQARVEHLARSINLQGTAGMPGGT